MNHPPEKRKYERYDTEIKLYFDLAFDVETKVKYQLLDKDHKKVLSRKYPALSKNVSAEGLSFVAAQPLKKGDYLNLEVYLPKATQPVRMEGEVCWSRNFAHGKQGGDAFQTGVLLKKVNGQPVQGTIYFDKEYNVNWSIALESVLGKFKDIAKERNSRK